MPLIEERRTQLDGIVNQMIQNKESEDDIQWVVNDFKSKYEENVPIQVETPVGGTYVPKMFPVGGGKAPGISTITGKPEMEYHPGKQPEASFTTMMKAGLADDPFIKMKIFSVDRGIPIERYRLNPKDQVEFKDNEGNWQREVGEATESKIKNVAATVTGDPRAILGTAGGMIAGIPGMVGGTVLGAVARKAGATLVFGERRK